MRMPPLLKDETFTCNLCGFLLLLYFHLVLYVRAFLCNLSTFASSIVLGRGLKQSVCFDLKGFLDVGGPPFS